MKEKVTFDVLGMSLSLQTEKSEEYVIALAKQVEEKANRILLSNRNCTKAEALFLCALDYLDEKNTAETELTVLRGIR